MIYLWEGFWNGFLLGQTCEIPATARGNHFRAFVCLDNLDMFICGEYLTHAFSELNQKSNPNACKSPANARTFPTRDFTASCDTTCKNHFMCASGDGKRSKHAEHKSKKQCIVAVNAKVKVQLTTSKLS